MSFIDNLRDILTEERTDVVHGQLKNLPVTQNEGRQISPEEQASNGFAYLNPEKTYRNSSITAREYEDFASKNDAFNEMMNAWADEDDYVRRNDIIDQYDKQYNFGSNMIHRELMNTLTNYEKYYANNPMRDPGDLPAYSYFDVAENRNDYLNWVKNKQEEAGNLYSHRRNI